MAKRRNPETRRLSIKWDGRRVALRRWHGREEEPITPDAGQQDAATVLFEVASFLIDCGMPLPGRIGMMGVRRRALLAKTLPETALRLPMPPVKPPRTPNGGPCGPCGPSAPAPDRNDSGGGEGPENGGGGENA